MCWSSSSTKRGHDERAVDEAGLDDLGDPPVDDRAGVDDDVRLAAADGRPSSGSGRRTMPIASAAVARSLRLATVSPTIPRPRKRETPIGSHVPSGGGSVDSGRPSRTPMSRPIRRPTTAATNSAVDSCWTWRISQPAGTTVMYGRIANPAPVWARRPPRWQRGGRSWASRRTGPGWR